ncbi:MAG: MazG nucleotide pyrophosphohydrolase domain-containing protein [Planctomycetota bacterium]|nr:MazG nucleotide pyrophosphohydrolase domain-containing protein [Planctomycetota bacterium]
MKNPESNTDLGLREFQKIIESTYYQKDSARGVEGSFMWLVEEVGELARTLNSGDPGSREEQAEFADVLAWIASLASLRGVDLAQCVIDKYSSGCPRCENIPCQCQHRSGDEC